MQDSTLSAGTSLPIIDEVAGVSVNQVFNAFPKVTVEFNIATVARLCHEINRVWCTILGDNSQTSWEDAPDWQRQSAIDGVNYHLDNVATTPRDSHMNWLKTKQSEGWSWGPVKDPAKKQHPCFCSYDLLPTTQQVKDHLFWYTVQALKPLLFSEHARKSDSTQLTEGERIAGITFNPSHDWRIDFMKGLYAELYDFINRFQKDKSTEVAAQRPLDNYAITQVGRSAAEAKTCLQTSKMFCIEGLTR